MDSFIFRIYHGSYNIVQFPTYNIIYRYRSTGDLTIEFIVVLLSQLGQADQADNHSKCVSEK